MAGKDTITFSKAELAAFASNLFVAAGCARAMADEWASILVWANLRGVDSHGVIRIPRYLDLLRRKTINTAPNIRVEKRAGAVSIMEADRAPGVIGMARAMEEAIARARDVSVGWCAARNVTHTGAIGYFALMAAEAGMAGIAMGASSPMMAYYGARVAGVSSNPLAFAVPGKHRKPLIVDMSTANVAMGKVHGARDAGAEVPRGWGIDAEGRDTTDPKKIATLLPLGGPKGSGLSLLIECLTSVALGNPLVSRALIDKDIADNPVQNGLAIAVDLSVFGDLDQYESEVDRLGDAIVALPRAEGVDRIFLPGERGYTVAAEREVNGIPVPRGTWNRIVAAAEPLGVKPPVP
jgi:LDH2 family malate/lactate/ureidoglycolate dehydrogenase